MLVRQHARSVHVAYLVSRFPHASETFIVRELDAMRDAGVSIELLSLFPATSGAVHPRAKPWTERLRRPVPAAALAALGWWAVRRPWRLAATIARVGAATARRPSIGVRSLVTVALAAAHARRLAGGDVTHVHAHYATYPALAAWVAWRLAGVPYSFTAHAHDLYVDQSMLATKVADARFVVAISEFNRRFLADYGGDVATPVAVIHCGVEPEAYPFRPRRPPAAGPVSALCVASLQEYKGQGVLLEAIASAGPARRVRVDLVGDGPLRERLEGLARELALGDRVRFHGSQPEQEVTRLLDAADLFVLPSVVARDGQMEGLPVALMEALATGVPAVATRLSGIPELIHDGTTGLLAEPGDVDSLREALERALAGAPPLDPAAGRALVEEQFDVRRSAALLRGLLVQTG